jgi:hypothetical protein
VGANGVETGAGLWGYAAPPSPPSPARGGRSNETRTVHKNRKRTVGRGVAQNYKQAVYWYRKAAAASNPKAQYNLGQSYEQGAGVPQDKQQAIQWYRKAADQSDNPDIRQLAQQKLSQLQQ